VLNNGTPCLMNAWLDAVPGVVEAWFPGQEGGSALAALLFGDVNPSGKLPDTLGAAREDYPDTGNFPGKNGQITYAEGIYVGYRHFDKDKIKPVFPFGFGLSYTTFAYRNLKLSRPALTPGGSVTASVDVTNTGTREGSEVVELYVHDPAPKIDKAVRELKGFEKIALRAGETRTVTFTIDGRSLAYCDVPGHRWKSDAGTYQIEVGASSRDIRVQSPLRLSADWTQAIPSSRETPAQTARR
jgi:beta-glucosidase